jgi:uncharacterized protein YgfB (UPF0149 family)
MKLSQLLATRKTIIRQANLANLAYAYVTLTRLADRVAAARLHGLVMLRQAGGEEEPHWASLTALEGNQSVIEEHFDDDDLMALADAIAYAVGHDLTDLEFNLEELSGKYVAPLRHALDKAGVAIDLAEQTSDHPAQ